MAIADVLVLILGADVWGTGVALRLKRAGFTVLLTEDANPRLAHPIQTFSDAVRDGQVTVDGMMAVRVEDALEAVGLALLGDVPVIVDPAGESSGRLRPHVVVDARVGQPTAQSSMSVAPLVVGLGAGMQAGVDCHAVVGARRGLDLGRVYWSGQAAATSTESASLEDALAVGGGVLEAMLASAAVRAILCGPVPEEGLQPETDRDRGHFHGGGSSTPLQRPGKPGAPRTGFD